MENPAGERSTIIALQSSPTGQTAEAGTDLELKLLVFMEQKVEWEAFARIYLEFQN